MKITATACLVLIAAGLAHAQPGSQAKGQAYPTKPVRVIVPFAPGGGSGILARQLAPKLNEHLGQSFIIDNRGGAGGLVGTEIAAKAAPDGYTLITHIKSGRLHGLAVTTAERWPATPNIPTVAETLPGYDVELWFGMWAPKGTPAAIVERLNAAVNKALRDPDVEKNLSASGFRISGGPPQRFAERIRKDLARWNKVVIEAGAKPD